MLNWRLSVTPPLVHENESLLVLNVSIVPSGGHGGLSDVIFTTTAERYHPLSPEVPLTIVYVTPVAPAPGARISASATATAAAVLTSASARTASGPRPTRPR